MTASPAPNPLATKPVGRLLLAYAIPGIISQLVSSINNIVDQIFLGWSKVGDLGIAATNIVFPLFAIITGLAAFIGMGGVSKFSLLLGDAKHAQAATVMGNAITAALVISVFVAACASIFLEPMLYLFGATDTIMATAIPYARIISLGIPCAVVATCLTYFIRADGNPTYASAVLIACALFNMAFDPVFLYLFDLGIAGVALATVLGQVLSAGLALFYLRRRFSVVAIAPSDYRPRLRVLGTIFALGAAMLATHGLATASQIIQMNALKTYGACSVYGSDAAITAAGAVGKLSIVFLSAIVGIAVGAQPILGYNLGAKAYGRVKKTYLVALGYGTLVAVAAYLLLQTFPAQMLAIFGSDDPLFIDFGVSYIRSFLAMLFLNAIQPITATFCTAMGKAQLGFWMAVVRQGILLIPLLLLLPLAFGIEGVLWSGAISDGVAGLVALAVGLGQIRKLTRLQGRGAQSREGDPDER